MGGGVQGGDLQSAERNTRFRILPERSLLHKETDKRASGMGQVSGSSPRKILPAATGDSSPEGKIDKEGMLRVFQ